MDIILDTMIFGMQKAGGVAVYWNEMYQRFIKDPNNDLYILELEKGYINPEFKMLDISKFQGNKERGKNLQIVRNCEPQIKKKIVRPTIFQSTYLRVSHKCNIKNIVTVHDFIYQLFRDSSFNNTSKLKLLLNDFQKRIAFRAAAGIVCISENTKRDLLKLYPFIDEKKVRVIHNAASDEYFPLVDKSFPEKYKSLEKKKYIMYVGHRGGYKNFEFLTKVIMHTQDLYCVLVGGDPLSDKDKEMMGDSSNRFIQFRGVTNRDLNILYNNAFCFIFPSLYEGFGIPVLEAMRTKCPVIAFNNSSIPEVMRGSGILLENNDLDGCLSALERFEDSAYRNKIAEEGYIASKLFSWDKTYERYIEFYQEVLNNE